MRPYSITSRFWSKVDKSGECWLWTAGTMQTGYGHFHMRGRNYRAHRVAWELTYGPIPEGMFVCHICDTPGCVRPSHLWLGTAAENSADMVAKRRTAAGENHPARLRPESRPRGETHPMAKVDAAAIIAIRQRYAQGGITQTELARMFGLDQTHISDIVRRKVWKHL